MTKQQECEATFHRFYSLDPQATEDGSKILVISICSNCGKAIEYRTSIKKPE